MCCAQLSIDTMAEAEKTDLKNQCGVGCECREADQGYLRDIRQSRQDEPSREVVQAPDKLARIDRQINGR
jgi:hypothetical protein